MSSLPMNGSASAVRVGVGVRVRVGVLDGVGCVGCGVSVTFVEESIVAGVAVGGGAPSKWTLSMYTTSPDAPCAAISILASDVSGTAKSKEIVCQRFATDAAYSWRKLV